MNEHRNPPAGLFVFVESIQLIIIKIIEVSITFHKQLLIVSLGVLRLNCGDGDDNDDDDGVI